ncbi:uncharacterized protein [Aegilops tauschii subsp. strangulata]|uniref:uncharacterized protein n=1 Tax=Aegilops tauschii subsp. strangulata TaxID=200361 RepID=UPI00098B80BF|nr:uncharacterized protein LOC109759522 [Aegilops tauschii subsp. strangulata]
MVSDTSPSAAMDTNPVSSPRSSHDGDGVLRDAAGDAPGDGVLHDAILPDAAAVAAATAAAPVLLALRAFPSSVLQTIDICHHVTIVLDLHGGNYTQWRRFFNTVVGMLSVCEHILAEAAPLRRHHDPEWDMVDHCIVHWLYTTISPELVDAVMQLEDTAATLWATIESIFRDNQLSRAVYLDAEYHTVIQGDLTIMQYCARLKSFTDQLRDLGQTITDTQQLFNMLRGLNTRYHHAIPHLTSRVPLPTFLQARSFLLLEEHRAEQSTRQ